MNIIDEYIEQQTWRNWNQYLQKIPMDATDRVIDFGCSVGGVANLLSKHVTLVTGIDSNNDFIDYCLLNKKPNQNFICDDFSKIGWNSLGSITGAWASFSISYLKNPMDFLTSLYKNLQPGGWVALIDVSSFLSGNMSLDSNYCNLVRKFELESWKSGLYDFNFGSKMEALVEQAGFHLIHVDNDVTDSELNFDGAASAKVLLNWNARLQRMQGLRNHFPAAYSEICEEIITNLRQEKHCKRNNVRFVVARKI